MEDGGAPLLTGSEREFRLEELFYSTTDPKGHIEGFNHVFQRVSGYDADTLVGSPHNVIRHPDMPRSVFQVFWKLLKEGSEVAAYVNNRAATGEHYWVMALAVSTPSGFLSVRFKPISPMFKDVQEIYADVLQAERSAQAQGSSGREVMAVGRTRLEELLAERGFGSYEAFMRTALTTEVTARQDVIGGSTNLGQRHPAMQQLDDQVASLDGYGKLAESLEASAGAARRFAQDIRLFAINASVRSARKGTEGAAIGAVSSTLGILSTELVEAISELGDSISQTTTSLDTMRFRIAAARLQAEMIEHAATDHRIDADACSVISPASLGSALGDSAERLHGATTQLHNALSRLTLAQQMIAERLTVASAIAFRGKVEAEVIRDREFGQLFARAKDDVDASRTQIEVIAQSDAVVGGMTPARTTQLIRYLQDLAANASRHGDNAPSTKNTMAYAF